MPEHVDDSVLHVYARLRAIQWASFNYAHQRSAALLMQEYLRRAALWAVAVGAETWPFFDIAGRVAPGVRAPKAFSSDLEQHLLQFQLPRATTQTCLWALEWAVVGHSPLVTGRGLPDPFEPLIRLWERGGTFTREKDMVVVGAASILCRIPRDWYSFKPIAPIDDANLDIADAAGTQRRAG